MITEVEAYDGERDLACHARVECKNGQNRGPLYGLGGHWYVYLCYGIHEMLNLVVGPKDWPAAILIRGVEGLMGPGRLTKGLQITRSLNAKRAHQDSDLWIELSPEPVDPTRIIAGPRVGVDYAGPIWSKVPWRFTLRAIELPAAGEGHSPKKVSLSPGPLSKRGRAKRAEPTSPVRLVRTKSKTASRTRRRDDSPRNRAR